MMRYRDSRTGKKKPLKFFNNISKWILLTEDVLG